MHSITKFGRPIAGILRLAFVSFWLQTDRRTDISPLSRSSKTLHSLRSFRELSARCFLQRRYIPKRTIAAALFSMISFHSQYMNSFSVVKLHGLVDLLRFHKFPNSSKWQFLSFDSQKRIFEKNAVFVVKNSHFEGKFNKNTTKIRSKIRDLWPENAFSR